MIASSYQSIVVDGVTKYYRNNGRIGEGGPGYYGTDYMKFATDI